MNLFLIGYRCSGKTSVGRVLSKKLGLAFVDADERLMAAETKSIAELVDEKGWDYFRRREKEMIKAICSGDGQVVATGGGVILDPDNVAAMKNCGRLIWLKAAADNIRKRMRQDGRTDQLRPALTVEGAADEIESTLKTRTPYYRAAMHFSVETDSRSLEAVCDRIVEQLKEK